MGKHSLSGIAIVSATRTPIGNLGGAFLPLRAHQLGAQAIKASLERAGVSGDEVDETIMGQVLTAAAGMNPIRQAARLAGVSDAAPALNINQVCGSGLRAVALAAQQIETGSADVVVAGGQESMSNAPHAAVLRKGKKFGDLPFIDTMMHDGLSDAFFGYPMGATAENVAKKYELTRDQQDEFALASQLKASAAQKAATFVDEIVPVTVADRRGDRIVDADEFIRHDSTQAGLAKLAPAFDKNGTVTAGNSSGINDGAAALVLMSSETAAHRGVRPLAKIASWAHTGIDPAVMGLGPISASQKALERAGWAIHEVDLWEVNEAFAAQSLAVIRDLGLDEERVNVNGGAIALGHPIGASGARVLVTLLHEMVRRDAKRGVATLCIGGGMGIAMCLERSEI